MQKQRRNNTKRNWFHREDGNGMLLILALYGALGIAALVSLAGKRVIESINHAFVDNTPNVALAERIQTLVAGHPIERMVPYIIQQDETTAAYLIAIAKKESNWGMSSPQKDGEDCYNYWGYRGPENQTDSGYSCFQSRYQAVSVVGRRLSELIAEQLDTPRKLVVWKRGFLDSPLDASSEKWVSDVDFYIRKLEAKE